MKIYGQNAKDVFAKLPWQYKIIVVGGLAFVLFAVINFPLAISRMHRALNADYVREIEISTITPAPTGFLDPSLAYDPKNKKLWLAYTAQEPVKNNPAATALSTRLALSLGNSCLQWNNAVRQGFEAKKDALMAPDGITTLRKGMWRVETPSLVYDAGDKGREWKLFAYKYFWPEDTTPEDELAVAAHYGVIVYKTATDPSIGWTSEQWLFSPGPNYPPAPYSQNVLLNLVRLDPSLADIVTYSRPSALVKDDVLYLTLSAFTKDMTLDRVVMIVSRDHGNSWAYAGTPLRLSDLQGTPYTAISGASLIEQEGQVYLAAALVEGAKGAAGTAIYGFDDLAVGALRHDAKTGVLAPARVIPLPFSANVPVAGGPLAYSDGCKKGMLISEQRTPTGAFGIYKVKDRPVK